MNRLAVEEIPRVVGRKQRDSADRRAGSSIGVSALLGAIFLILFAGWLHRNDPSFAPQHGLGYALGIVGGSMLLLVLLYPLRKRVKFMRNWARLAPWFRWHMIFGSLGPVLLVVHANFGTQSLNGLMALSSTLIVAASGVIGRYLYVRIHRGLYGAKLEARELLTDAISIRPSIGMGGTTGPSSWEDRLRGIEKEALAPAPTLAAAFRKAVVLSASTRQAERAIVKNELRHSIHAAGPLNRAAQAAAHADMRKRLARYFRSLRRAGSLAVYERLFGLWHVLHLPLIVLLIFTAIIHVIAVHLY